MKLLFALANKKMTKKRNNITDLIMVTTRTGRFKIIQGQIL